MDPMDRVKLERRIDNLLTAKDSDVRSLGLQAQAELKAKRWAGVEPLVVKAEKLWHDTRPMRLIDRLVQTGHAPSAAAARRLVQNGLVLLNGEKTTKVFAEVSAQDEVSITRGKQASA